MLKYYFNLSPNPMKVALLLEELDLPYQAIPVDTRKGEQFSSSYLSINPNGKVPALVDGDAVIFDSNAILLYLGDKTGRFTPLPSDKARGELLSWMMFIASGMSPFSGQAVHFRHFAPETVPYAQNRYSYEAERHYRVLDDRLKDRRYLVAETYTIADMAMWGWARVTPFVMGDDAWSKFPNLKRLVDEINERPAAIRAVGLKDKYNFKAELDEEARRIMYPQNIRLYPNVAQ
ncbi:glutathione S-transferase family protein [Microvirga pudoricolor]|uniref:glutathione S-transferase family protein n=1 Tax=Microvirga pudoricolor TaxID=2778729 RepID=UPI0019522C46|nr:glutathione S-transferase family protein [Microvirga pudoricolor]MBM6596703.1 glutathione S-transferase family protein [Microvirga pudoricolor]